MIDRCPKTGKRKFDRRQDAEVEMQRIRRRDSERGMRAFRCDPAKGGCGSWHFGHVRQDKRRRRSAVRGS